MNSYFHKNKMKIKFPMGDKVYTVRSHAEGSDVVYLDYLYNPKVYTKKGIVEVGFVSWRFASLEDKDISFDNYDDPEYWKRIRF